MSEELDILKLIADNPSISQRKIAEQAGISLGQVNFMIKKCVRKGLIKIEGQTTKSIKYNLTPKGLAEKAALTLEYVKVSYAAVIALTDKIRTLGEEYGADGKTLYIYGSKDEMMEIVKLALTGSHVAWEIWREGVCIPDKIELMMNTSDHVIFCWDRHHIENLESYPIEVINVLA